MDYDHYILLVLHALLTMDKSKVTARELEIPPKIFVDVCKVCQSTCGFITGITYEIHDRKAHLNDAEVTEAGLKFYNNNKQLLKPFLA